MGVIKMISFIIMSRCIINFIEGHKNIIKNNEILNKIPYIEEISGSNDITINCYIAAISIFILLV